MTIDELLATARSGLCGLRPVQALAAMRSSPAYSTGNSSEFRVRRCRPWLLALVGAQQRIQVPPICWRFCAHLPIGDRRERALACQLSALSTNSQY
jgi:hypothetical protein